MDTLQDYATQFADIVGNTDGTENAFNGIDETTQELRISVDKEKAMKKGLTVAQVFMDITGMLSSEQEATLLETGKDSITVDVVDGSAKGLTEKDTVKLIRVRAKTIEDAQPDENKLTDILNHKENKK